MKWRLKRQRINEMKSWFFEKINNIDKPLAKLTKRREKMKIIKIRDEKEVSQQIPMKFRGSLRNTLKTHILINWKM
jgi:hypothetical protein